MNRITHHLAASLATVFVSVALVGQFGSSLKELEDQLIRLASHLVPLVYRHSYSAARAQALEMLLSALLIKAPRNAQGGE
jgi:hypothetical protein